MSFATPDMAAVALKKIQQQANSLWGAVYDPLQVRYATVTAVETLTPKRHQPEEPRMVEVVGETVSPPPPLVAHRSISNRPSRGFRRFRRTAYRDRQAEACRDREIERHIY